jgi:hypothetical protein
MRLGRRRRTQRGTRERHRDHHEDRQFLHATLLEKRQTTANAFKIDGPPLEVAIVLRQATPFSEPHPGDADFSVSSRFSPSCSRVGRENEPADRKEIILAYERRRIKFNFTSPAAGTVRTT